MTSLRVGGGFAEALGSGEAALRSGNVRAEVLGSGPASLRAGGSAVEVLGVATAFLRAGGAFVEVLASTGPAPPPSPAFGRPEMVERGLILGVTFELFDGSQVQPLRLSNAGAAVQLIDE